MSFRLTGVFELDKIEHWQVSTSKAREMGVCEEISGAVSKLGSCHNRLLMAAGAADVNSGLIVQREEGDHIEREEGNTLLHAKESSSTWSGVLFPQGKPFRSWIWEVASSVLCIDAFVNRTQETIATLPLMAVGIFVAFSLCFLNLIKRIELSHHLLHLYL